MPAAFTLDVDLISPSGTIHLVARGFNFWNRILFQLLKNVFW
ncbi:MAG: hypothetical protein ACI8YP_002529 [Algoriphagus sp.]|jgi:hypothetical protein